MSYCFHDCFNSSSSCIHFSTFHFLHNSLEKQLCIDSFSFFSLFKKVLSLWIFSEDVLTDELWFQHCFPDLLSSGVSFSLWVCSLKLVLWSSWTVSNSQYCNPHASSVLCLSFVPQDISWSMENLCSPSSTGGKASYWSLGMLISVPSSLVFEKSLTLLTQSFSGTEFMNDVFVHEFLVLFFIILIKQ